MPKSEFLNRIRSLYNIDKHLLPELTPGQWWEFQQDPPRFLIGCEDHLADAILREVEKRQTLWEGKEPIHN